MSIKNLKQDNCSLEYGKGVMLITNLGANEIRFFNLNWSSKSTRTSIIWL